MDSLFTLQYTCLLVFAMIMLQLIVSRLYLTSTTLQYEKSRLLLIATAIVLAQWKFSGDKHKSLQVDTERTFHQRYPLAML